MTEGSKYSSGNYKIYLPEYRFQHNFTLYQVGYEKCKPEHKFGPCVRDFYVLHFIIEGKGYISVDGKVTKAGRGDLFLVPVGKRIEYYAEKSDPYEYYWVGFFGISAGEVLKMIGFDEGTYVLKTEDYARTLDAMRELCDFGETNINNFVLHGSFYRLIALLTERYEREKAQKTDNAMLDKLMTYIEANYSGKITLDDLAEYASAHRSTVYRLFKENTGKSPQEYIIEKRLDKALFLLKNTSMQIKEIAYLTGFSDTAYFCKMFKKKHRKSPQLARKLL